MDTINIDIGDWVDEAKRAEVEFADKDVLLAEHVRNQWTPLRAGRLAIAARHLGRAPGDLLPANKLLLNTGAAVDIVQTFARRRRQARIDGKKYQVRAYVGSVRTESPDDDGAMHSDTVAPDESVEETFILSTSEEGATRAREYLEKVVPGHVWSRLLILAEHGEPVAEIAEALKARVDEMVERLTEEASSAM